MGVQDVLLEYYTHVPRNYKHYTCLGVGFQSLISVSPRQHPCSVQHLFLSSSLLQRKVLKFNCTLKIGFMTAEYSLEAVGSLFCQVFSSMKANDLL